MGPISTYNSKIMAKILFNLILSKHEIKFKVRSKKVKFWNFDILKKLHVSDAEWAQKSNGAISCSVSQIDLAEISFLYMTSQFSIML